MLNVLALVVLASPVQDVARTPAAGLRWLDLDRDGDLDALALLADGRVACLRQDSGRAFVDATAELGLDGLSGVRDAVVADLDQDGGPDLVFGGADGLRILRHRAAGAYEDVTTGSGLAELGEVRALEWIDVEGDGRLDLHVKSVDAHRVFVNLGEGSFAELAGFELEPGPRPQRATPTRPIGAAPEEPPEQTQSRSAPARDADLGSGSRTATPPGPELPSAPSAGTLGLTACIKSISDQGLPGSCLEASSIPELGRLHPLSEDFNIDPATGWVAINTTTPDTRLHVMGQGRFQGNSEASTNAGTGMLHVLANDGVSGLGIDADELQSWGAPLFLNPEGGFGTRLNETLIVDPTGLVGVGREPALSMTLDVDGIVRAADTIISTKPAGAPFLIASSDWNQNLNADLLDGFDSSAFSQFGSQVDGFELADGAVSATKVAAGALDDSHVAPAAAIAGTKVAPDFGAQDVITTGRVAIGTAELGEQLTVAGVIETTSGGIRFPDGTVQDTAQLVGPPGPAGPAGPPGPPGPTEPPEPAQVLGTWEFEHGGETHQQLPIYAFAQRHEYVYGHLLPVLELTVEMDGSAPMLHAALLSAFRMAPDGGFDVTLDELNGPAGHLQGPELTLSGEEFLVVDIVAREYLPGRSPRMDVTLMAEELEWTYDDGQGGQATNSITSDLGSGRFGGWALGPHVLDPLQYRVWGHDLPDGGDPGYEPAYMGDFRGGLSTPDVPFGSRSFEVTKPLSLDTSPVMARAYYVMLIGIPGGETTQDVGIEFAQLGVRYDFTENYVSGWEIATVDSRVVETITFTNYVADPTTGMGNGSITAGGASAGW